MGSRQLMHHCKHCSKQTMHLGVSTSHILHLILAVITGGLWLPVWLLVTLSNEKQGQCTECGQKYGVFGS